MEIENEISAIADELGDAGAITPSLFLGNSLNGINHWVLNRAVDIDAAVAVIQSGGTVLTPSPEYAEAVLLALGVSVEEAQQKITRADTVLDVSTQISF